MITQLDSSNNNNAPPSNSRCGPYTQCKQTNVLHFLQINLHHCRGASSLIQKKFDGDPVDLVLISEPWVRKGVRGLSHKSAKLVCDFSQDKPRAALLIRKNIQFLPMANSISRDLVPSRVTHPRQ